MSELWAAVVGSLIGAGLSAWVVIWQTRRTLRHDLEQAREERRERERAERRTELARAAGALLDVLADYATVPTRHSNPSAWFGGRGTVQEHHARVSRIRSLQRAGYMNLHLMPAEISKRWRRLVWLAQVAAGDRERPDQTRLREAHDVWSYSRYVRDSLVASIKNEAPPSPAPPPDPSRDGERLWGFNPPEGSEEPDYTDWIQTRFGASNMVTLKDGTKRLPDPEM